MISLKLQYLGVTSKKGDLIFISQNSIGVKKHVICIVSSIFKMILYSKNYRKSFDACRS